MESALNLLSQQRIAYFSGETFDKPYASRTEEEKIEWWARCLAFWKIPKVVEGSSEEAKAIHSSLVQAGYLKSWGKVMKEGFTDKVLDSIVDLAKEYEDGKKK